MSTPACIDQYQQRFATGIRLLFLPGFQHCNHVLFICIYIGGRTHRGQVFPGILRPFRLVPVIQSIRFIPRIDPVEFVKYVQQNDQSDQVWNSPAL